jgi:predicted acylesterase/phospholipase RssA
MIEHVVLSGGGPNCMIQLGIVSELKRCGHLDHVKSVYGTSAGAIICVALALGISIDDFITYIVDRPWQKWLDVNLMLSNEMGGMAPAMKINDMLTPMLTAAGIDPYITMKEAFERTGVDTHIFTTEIKSFTLVDLNHLSFPDLPMVYAASMSSSIFPLFSPFVYKDVYYSDGGMRNNFPMDVLLDKQTDPETILGINILGTTALYTDKMTFLETIYYIMLRTATEIGMIAQTHKLAEKCKYYVGYTNTSILSYSLWSQMFTEPAFRRAMVDKGVATGQSFILEKF